jgi:hypothetical protein
MLNATNKRPHRANQTFENEPLSGDTMDFDCLSLEVWGFK